MPKNDRQRTRKARALMRQRPGLLYTQALAEVDAAHAPRPQDIDPVLLAPYPDEDGVAVEELGWRVLPPDATPAQKARAEAVWRPVRPGRPCRCSGPCQHGRTCGDEGQDGPCSGLLIHADRFPGSLFSLAAWNDVYQCADCGDQFEQSIVLEAIPWGEHPDGEPNTTRVYPGVRHPNFRDASGDEDDDDEDNWSDEPDGSCRGCGAYAMEGLLCDGCRSKGWTDGPQGYSEPDRDDPRYLQSIGVCLECGAGQSSPYDECTCYDDEDGGGPEDPEPACAEAQ